jgi:PLP dependent protein
MSLAPSAGAVADRLAGVRRRIEAAAQRAGKAGSEVQVVVVTKGHSSSVVREAYAAGARQFGENRVEELSAKAASLPDLKDAVWHMVGHIQSRKVRDLWRGVAMVHSVDRLKIAQRLNDWAGEEGRRLEVLLECNVSGESTKAGWRLGDRKNWEAALPEIEAAARLPHLSTLGLMTMAPEGAEPDAVRAVFRRLAELRGYLVDRLGLAWPHLSMGMTEDFEIAVEEGATLVRVGRAILGERPLG